MERQTGKSSDQTQRHIDSTANTLVWNQLGLMGATGILILAGICTLFVLRVTLPLNRLRQAMQDIAAGEGDLTRRLEGAGKDEISLLARAFNQFADKIQKVLLHANDSTVELNQAATTLTGHARSNDQNVNQQLMETQQVATAITQVAATIREIASSADSATNAVRATNSEATGGKEAMMLTVETINALAAEVENASAAINRLQADSESIGTVINVIGGIAEQTNLLALNAAIEAARAGEHGRGFAVVAAEVRTLAGRTQESTSEIQAIIENLQAGTRNAAHVMQGSLTRARETVEMANRAGTALDNIAQSVSTILDMNYQIATASEEHTAVTQEIDHSVVRISEASMVSAAGSNQITQMSQELSELSSRLHALVSQFRI
ncbi:MAG: methyl-accepting chemotaxis protein [gamma proteobacterium symbiont of Phacoides pectinatus]